MYRKIEHVSENLYELKAKLSIDDFFNEAIRGEITLAPVGKDIICNPGEPTGITLPR